MLKKISSVLLLIFLAYIASFSQVNDQKANTILQNLADKMKSYSSMKIEFTYILENKAEKINQSKTGVITVKGDKYYLNISGQRIISDGKTVWTYIPDADEVQINNVNPDDENAINPAKLLTNYNQNYRAKLIKEFNSGGTITQVIDLIPLKGKAFFKIRINVDKNKLQILSTEIYNKNGSTYSYKVTKFTPNLKTLDSEFVFKPSEFPGVEINDMR